jgi:sulfatase modifying factor 1
MRKNNFPHAFVVAALFVAGITTLTSPLHADTFGTGANQFTIDFTTIGNPGNSIDTTSGWGVGGVSYTYRMGTYSISQNQIDAATASGLANVTAGAWSGDQPAANISWYGAAAFVNWLNTSTGNQAAYKLSYADGAWSMSLWNSFDPGYNSYNQYRNANAYYFLPSMDEWYKAAYGKSDGSGYYLYPTGSDTAPTAVASGTTAGTAVYNQSSVQGPASVYEAGGLSSYGTMGQGGNIGQWLETHWQGNNTRPDDPRGFPSGASWSVPVDLLKSSFHNYTGEADSPSYSYIGLRVASVVPEPSTYALIGIGVVALLIVSRKKSAKIS